MAGILSKGITLSYATTSTGTYTAIANLQSIPDLLGDAEQVDVTCLDDEAFQYINGIKNYGTLEFGLLYDTTEFAALNDLDGDTTYFEIEFPDNTTFSFSGQPHCKINGVGVNAPIQYTLQIALQSDITVA